MTSTIKTVYTAQIINVVSKCDKKNEKSCKAYPKCRVCHKFSKEIFATITNDFGERKVICSETCLTNYVSRSKKNNP